MQPFAGAVRTMGNHAHAIHCRSATRALPGHSHHWLSQGSRGQACCLCGGNGRGRDRSEEHTSELQSLMRTSYAVFCLKKKTHKHATINLTSIVMDINR